MSGAFRSAGVGVVGRSDVRRGSLRARYSPLGRAASMSLVSGRGGRVHFMQVPLGDFFRSVSCRAESAQTSCRRPYVDHG
jgi:hypothetical protein